MRVGGFSARFIEPPQDLQRGLTISGGEPTAQYAFCAALLRAAKAEAIHTCLDICGALGWPRLDALRRDVDVFLYDYKATDPALHRKLSIGDGKYDDLDRSRPTLATHVPTEADKQAWLSVFHSAGAARVALG